MNKELPTIILEIKPFFPGMKKIFLEKVTTINSIEAAKKSFNNQFIVTFLKPNTDHETSVYSINNVEPIGLLTTIETDSFDDEEEVLNLNMVGAERVNLSSFYFKDNHDCYFAEYTPFKEDEVDENTENIWLESIKNNIEFIKSYNTEYYNSINNMLNGKAVLKDKIFFLCNKLFSGNTLEIYNKSIFQLMEHIVNSDTLNAIKLRFMIESKAQQKLSERQQKMWLQEQLSVINEEINSNNTLKNRILKAKLPDYVKKVALEECEKLANTPSNSSEHSLIHHYINDWILGFPWNKKKKSCINLKQAKEILNKSHYGMDEAKESILEALALMKNNPECTPPVFLFVGAPGVGKSTFCEAIAEACFGIEKSGKENRYNMIRISLAAANDPSRFKGFSRTYVGATPGEIVKKIKIIGYKNPIIVLDEIDKISPEKGTIHILVDLLDPEFRGKFDDSFMGVSVDLSNCIFICIANDISNIPSFILNRCTIIRIPSYLDVEKTAICEDFIIPKQLKRSGLPPKSIQFSQGVIKYIIKCYTMENGLRQLTARIGKILSSVIIQHDSDISAINETKPVIVTEEMVDKVLRRKMTEDKSTSPAIGIVNGLYYSGMGGGVTHIEATIFPSKREKLEICGNMGTSMSESVKNALAYIRSISPILNIPTEIFTDNTIHVNVWNAAQDRDGPSAGIAIATAIISVILKLPIPNDIGITGEVSINGLSLLVGGIREKSSGAERYGLKEIFIPINIVESEIPEKIQIKITKVRHISEIWRKIWPNSRIIENFYNNVLAEAAGIIPAAAA
jgi:ATP-dependent Lon protease